MNRILSSLEASKKVGKKTRSPYLRAATVLLGLLCVFAVVACGNSEEMKAELGQEAIAKDLYVYTYTLWPNPGNINVCWNNPEVVPSGELDWVADAVDRTWETFSAIDFVGWGACTPDSTGVRITIADVRPNAKGLGTQVENLETAMELNFTFQEWGCWDSNGNQYPCSWPYGAQNWTRRDFIEMVAVHEFGHILGFSHEQNRPDTPASCTEEKNGANGNVTYGDWDLDSVMNYCNPTWNNGGELSATDIAGLQAYYGDSGTTPTCSDGVRNQDEEGIDCGGVCGNICPDGDEFAIPARIEAEDCNFASDTTFGNEGDPDQCGSFGGVDMEVTSDPAGGGCNVGWTEAGEILGYDIWVDATQMFDITARLASQYTGASLRVEIDGIDVTGPLEAPASGWQSWEDRVATHVLITEGVHEVRVIMITDNVNINYLEFTSAGAGPTPTCDDGIQNQGETGIDCGGPCPACQSGIGILIPGRVEAEAFVAANDTTPGNEGDPGACGTSGDVDVEITGDSAGGGCNVGWVAAGEWLAYDIEVDTTQAFDITARLASDYSGRSLHVEIDGTDVTGPMVAPANGWQTYSDVIAENVTIAAGQHVVRVYMASDYLNLNYIDFTLSSGSVPTCDDGIQNQDEEGIDCGGSCPDACAVSPTCDDGIQNQGEQGVDCGGPCPACSTAGCTCSSGCDAVVTVSANFASNGADSACYFFSGSAGSYINSWNTVEVNLNGVDISNRWIGAGSYPAENDGGYYLYVHSTLPWAHVEVMN